MLFVVNCKTCYFISYFKGASFYWKRWNQREKDETKESTLEPKRARWNQRESAAIGERASSNKRECALTRERTQQGKRVDSNPIGYYKRENAGDFWQDFHPIVVRFVSFLQLSLSSSLVLRSTQTTTDQEYKIIYKQLNPYIHILLYLTTNITNFYTNY